MISDTLTSELVEGAVIFDADGTLIDSLTIFHQTCVNYIERKSGKRFKYQTLESFTQTLPRSFEQILNEHGMTGAHVAPITAEYGKLYLSSAILYPWVKGVIGKLEIFEKKMAICTNNHLNLVAPVFEANMLVFDPIICGVDFGLRKPELEFYRQLETVGRLELSSAKYFTDEIGDAIGAKKAGIDEVYLVTWGGLLRDEDIKDARTKGIGIVDNPEMIIDLVT